jgi:hypothetical protein
MAIMIPPISGNSAKLEEVKKNFATWRSGRAGKREPIPQVLWQAAAGLCREYSIARVSRELRLSYADLKKRIPKDHFVSHPFIEIDTAHLSGQWQIDCSRADGSRLYMTGSGQPPAIDTVLRSFLS